MPRSAKATTLRALDRLRDEISGAAHRHQVGALVLADRLDRRPGRARPCRSSRSSPVCASIISVNLSIRVAVVGPGGPDDFVAHRIDRADVVDHAIGEVDRQFLASSPACPAMRLCAASRPVSMLAAEQQRLARCPRRDFLLRQRVEVDAACCGCNRAASARRAIDRAMAARARPAPSRRARSARGASPRNSESSRPACRPRGSDTS